MPRVVTMTVLQMSDRASTSSRTLIATVNQRCGPKPTGTVTFRDNWHVIEKVGLGNAREAAFTATPLSPGRHVFAATYNGNGNDLASWTSTVAHLSASPAKAPAELRQATRVLGPPARPIQKAINAHRPRRVVIAAARPYIRALRHLDTTLEHKP